MEVNPVLIYIGMAALWLALLGVLISKYQSTSRQHITTKEQITPDIQIKVVDGVIDTTYIYNQPNG